MEPLSTAICFLLDKTQAALNHIFGTACKHLVQTLNYDILNAVYILLTNLGSGSTFVKGWKALHILSDT